MSRIPRIRSLKSLTDPTEKELTKQIMDYLKYIPNSAFKKTRGGLGMKGILDVIGCWQGRYVEIEIKTKRGKLKPHQLERIMQIRKAGGISGMIRSVEDVEEIFRFERLEVR